MGGKSTLIMMPGNPIALGHGERRFHPVAHVATTTHAQDIR